ncbi:MAG: hypothetical protein ACO1QS_12520 [Verrucomicrobiota bacterium]
MNPPIHVPEASRSSGPFLSFICTLVLALGLFTGCQTNKIDWATRIGTYTFDDAVKEMGPPDKTATLTDGTQVCEWLTYRGSDGGTVITSGHYGLYASSIASSPDAYLRLTFNPEKKLTEAKRLYK